MDPCSDAAQACCCRPVRSRPSGWDAPDRSSFTKLAHTWDAILARALAKLNQFFRFRYRVIFCSGVARHWPIRPQIKKILQPLVYPSLS